MILGGGGEGKMKQIRSFKSRGKITFSSTKYPFPPKITFFGENVSSIGADAPNYVFRDTIFVPPLIHPVRPNYKFPSFS